MIFQKQGAKLSKFCCKIN